MTFKGKKAEKVAMIKAHIGSLLYDSIERQQPRQPPLTNVPQQVTSSLAEVETDARRCRRSSCRVKPELILYRIPARKHFRRQNMNENGHGSRGTIMLVGTK